MWIHNYWKSKILKNVEQKLMRNKEFEDIYKDLDGRAHV